MKIDEEAKTFELNGHKFVEGDWISIDGSTGNIYGEQVATVAATGNKNFNRFMGWADAARQLLVMTNADNPRDAQQAVDLGAEGIGLCRTEHMFFAEDRIKAVREMICARTVEEREAALAKVEPFQQGDFEAMYRIMGERPMTIRYLDPPLHEFLPSKDEDIKELAADMGMTFDDLKNVVASLHEFNPMMGHRGCRLAVTYPEIAAMQTRAVIKAALNVSAETGYIITPHIMIPLVGEVKELKFVKDVVVKVADELIKASGVDMKYLVGTMIEIPRAALTAGEIAKEAEFFSFGTNDLTQMTFGFSRDDAAKFLALTTRTRSTRAIRSSIWTRSASASWSRWLHMMAVRPVPTWVWASAASTAAILPASSSATMLVWTTSAALPSVCLSHVWLLLRLRLRIPASDCVRA